MAESSIAGSRIRERRLQAGMRQAELAERAGISPSYLNLIEHNRRRIGGRILLRIAEVLQVEPAVLTEGAAATLIAGLREAAATLPEGDVEHELAEEFAERFPGWATLLTRTCGKVDNLERAVQALTDRLAHDPNLAERLHEVLSVVAAIRSTASILVETPSLEPEWQQRFHRNVDEDSRRLAEGAKALVQYLDADPGEAQVVLSPQDELDAFLEAHGHHFAELETGAEPGAVLSDAPQLASDVSRRLAEQYLHAYVGDARQVPMVAIEDGLSRFGPDPVAMATHLSLTPSVVFRRLAAMPADLVGELGFAQCDGAGALIIRRPIAGFSLPRMTGACPLWPLFAALGQPGTPLRANLVQAGQDGRTLTATALSETGPAPAYNHPPPRQAYMILTPAKGTGETGETTINVGVTCRVCPRDACPARREPSVLRVGLEQAGGD